MQRVSERARTSDRIELLSLSNVGLKHTFLVELLLAKRFLTRVSLGAYRIPLDDDRLD